MVIMERQASREKTEWPRLEARVAVSKSCSSSPSTSPSSPASFLNMAFSCAFLGSSTAPAPSPVCSPTAFLQCYSGGESTIIQDIKIIAFLHTEFRMEIWIAKTSHVYPRYCAVVPCNHLPFSDPPTITGKRECDSIIRAKFRRNVGCY